MSMLDRLRLRAASFTSSSPSPSASSNNTNSSSSSSTYRSARNPEPYEIPDPNGKEWLFALPDELLERVFVRLDRVSLARCHRVCKRMTDLLTTSAPISLHYTLQLASLRLNPHALHPVQNNLNHIPPSKAYLLNLLRERLTRFQNLKHKNSTRISFQESEGRLYEYLEGILLRNVPVPNLRDPGKEVAVYDLTKMGEWEDINDQSSSTSTTPASASASSSLLFSNDQSSTLPTPSIAARLNRKPLETQSLQHEEGQTGEGDEDAEGDEIVEETELVHDLRKTHEFDFTMQDFAVDPGQDLFVVAETRNVTPRQPGEGRAFTLHFHLLSLSTFEAHPRAAKMILDWPAQLHTRVSSLGFQICDDGLFVLRNNSSGTRDQLCGWQWTTGRLACTLTPPGVSTFESFVLLTPSSFIIPTVKTQLRPDSLIQDDLADARDLEFSHHLQLHAFPPFSSVSWKEGEPYPPPHAPIHVTTIDLPKFHVDLEQELPPPRMTIRTDPPPRHTFPTHPEEMPQPFLPDPESGTVIIEFYCQPLNGLFGRQPHYVLFAHKKTFLNYLPAPTSPLLFQAFPRPAPVLSWEIFAPKVRMIGPDEPSPTWVCYVYQNRYVVPYFNEGNYTSTIRLYDFDPLRVRRETFERRSSNFVGFESTSPRSIVRRLALGLSQFGSRRRSSSGTNPNPNSHPNADFAAGGEDLCRNPSGSASGSGHGSSRSKLPSEALGRWDGDRDGIHLITEETVLKKKVPLAQEVKTGRDMPFTYVEKQWSKEIDTVVMDGERLVLFDSTGEEEVMEVLDF